MLGSRRVLLAPQRSGARAPSQCLMAGSDSCRTGMTCRVMGCTRSCLLYRGPSQWQQEP